MTREVSGQITEGEPTLCDGRCLSSLLLSTLAARWLHEHEVSLSLSREREKSIVLGTVESTIERDTQERDTIHLNPTPSINDSSLSELLF